MQKYLILIFLFYITQAYAFEGDYFWEEQFKKIIIDAKQGDPQAQFKIAQLYEKGKGVDPDINKAIKWYKKSADQDYVKAQSKLGYMYLNGVGVPKNYSKAYTLLQIAATAGNARAQYYLAEMFIKGLSIKKDLKEAISWLYESSSQGYAPSEQKIAELNSKNNPVKKPTKSTRAKSGPPKNLRAVAKHLLKSHWLYQRKPSYILPSKMSNCKKTSNTTIECVSKKREIDTGLAKIKYISKALLTDLKRNGSFNLEYRNKVLKIKSYKQTNKNNSLKFKQIKLAWHSLGWQPTEHNLKCKISQNIISCTKDKHKKLKFVRKTNS